MVSVRLAEAPADELIEGAATLMLFNVLVLVITGVFFCVLHTSIKKVHKDAVHHKPSKRKEPPLNLSHLPMHLQDRWSAFAKA